MKMMESLLKQRDERKWQHREDLRRDVRNRLRSAPHALVPGQEVILFGSITCARAFHVRSDVDIAFMREPGDVSQYRLQTMLEERIGHPVDLIIISECRFREKIMREGERWTT